MFDQISQPAHDGNTNGPAPCGIGQMIKINGAWGCEADLEGLNWGFLIGATEPDAPARTTPEAPAPVPLPAGGVLLLGALAGLLGVKRKGGAE